MPLHQPTAPKISLTCKNALELGVICASEWSKLCTMQGKVTKQRHIFHISVNSN
jgi:hypothetical protein